MSNITPVKVKGEYYLRHNGNEKELHAALLEASDYCPVNITYKDKRYTVINDMAWGKSPDLIEATRLFLGAHEGRWEDFPEFAGH